MAIPRSKHTRSRRNKGRMHIFLKQPAFCVCPKCGKEILPHILCWNCGYYNGREIIDVLGKLTKKEQKKRKKEISAKEREEKGGKDMTMEELSKK